MLVVPAFELKAGQEVPGTRREVEEMVAAGCAEGFHVSKFPAGHSPTRFQDWFSASEPYQVEYREMFEPYVIAHKASLPRYDERFRGYGMNKIAHLYEVAARGARFVVLPHVFLCAHEHERSDAYRRVFGQDRDPTHAVRISMLWGAFKCQVRDKYPGFAALPKGVTTHPATQTRLTPPRPLVVDADGPDGGPHGGRVDGKEADGEEMLAPGRWMFHVNAPKSRRRVRISGLRRHKGSRLVAPCAAAAAAAASCDSQTASSAEEE